MFSELNSASATQKRLWKDYGRVAKKQGVVTEVFRPTNVLNPFVDSKITEIPVVFTNNYNSTKPDRYGVGLIFGIFDATGIKEGDYLVTQHSIDSEDEKKDAYFVASVSMNKPLLLVKAPRTISVNRATGPTGALGGVKGKLGYSGSTRETESVLMANYRASILQGTKGEINPVDLPLDMRMPWWIILLPAFPGVIIDTGDFIRDDLGRKYVVSSPELTDLGWRISAAYERA